MNFKHKTTGSKVSKATEQQDENKFYIEEVSFFTLALNVV